MRRNSLLIAFVFILVICACLFITGLGILIFIRAGSSFSQSGFLVTAAMSPAVLLTGSLDLTCEKAQINHRHRHLSFVVKIFEDLWHTNKN
jgi:hypothetical protein